MSGVSQMMARAIPPSAFSGNAGILSRDTLAAMMAADEMAMAGSFGWQRWQANPELGEEGDFFEGNARLVERVLSEVEGQLPRPNTPDAVADLSALLNRSTIAGMISSHHSVSSVVRAICSQAQKIVDEAEDRAQARTDAAKGGKAKAAVTFAVVAAPGALAAHQITDADRALIEERLRELRDLRDKAMDDLRERFAYEDGAWKITLGDKQRYVFIPHKSIRIADVKEIFVEGKRFFDVTIMGLPRMEGGKLIFDDVQTQRFGEDSALIRQHGKDTDGLAAKLMRMDPKTLLELIDAEKSRLETLAPPPPAPSETLAPSAIRGGVHVSADELCTLSPNSAALALLPQFKKPAQVAALVH